MIREHGVIVAIAFSRAGKEGEDWIGLLYS
jgi:hypothetical protein